MKNTKWIDFASVISAISVVYIHASSIFQTFSTDRYWLTANIQQNIFYFAVPVFFMISGATLMDFYKRYDLKQYFSKRISKTLVPYIFWLFFTILFQIVLTKQMAVSDLSLKMIISAILTGRAGKNQIYWFFPPLFGVYLCLPLFAAVPEEKRKSLFTFLAVSGFIVNVLYPFINTVFELGLSNAITMRVTMEYLLFVVIGYLLSHYEVSRPLRFLFYALAVAGTLLRTIGTYVLSIAAGEIVRTFWGYTGFAGVLQAVGVFVFLRYAGTALMKSRAVEKFINMMRGYTFPIYLLHWMFLQILLIFVKWEPRSITYRVLSPLIVIPMCILCTWLIRKIPGAKKILP